MTISTFSAANRLCRKSNWSITNLELQKLLYIAHMVHLGQYNAPLIDDHFEAWNYGPVQPNLYQHVKIFGSSPVKNLFHHFQAISDGSAEADVLDQAYDQLSHRSAAWLVSVTHWPQGAWSKYYRSGVMGIQIPNEDILQEYKDRVDAAKRRQQH